MNIANKLTVLRIVMVPFFMFFLRFNQYNKYFKLYFLDGFLARKNNITTNLGKFLDPLADKILTTAAFLCFLYLNLVDIFVVFIILAREFLVIFIRLVASKNGRVIAANFWGKLKTIFQIAACIATMLYLIFKNSFLYYSYNALIYSSTILTIVSGFLYIIQNRKVLKDL